MYSIDNYLKKISDEKTQIVSDILHKLEIMVSELRKLFYCHK